MAFLAAANVRSVHRRILAVALPAILANLTTVLPGLVDTAFIGRGGVAAQLGGVAIGTTFCSLILWAFSFLRTGTAGFTAQAFGAGESGEIRGTLRRALGLAWFFGFILLLLMVPLGEIVLPLYGGGDQQLDFAARYYHFRMFSAPFDLTLYVVLGWLLGLERPKTAFALQALLNGLNVLFCYVAVMHYNLGVDGVAISTSLAQFLTAIAGLVVVRRIARGIAEPRSDNQLLDVEKLVELMSVNTDIFIRTLALTFIFTYFIHLSAGLDETTLAANQILLGFMAFIANALDGFAQSAETLTGQAIGARDPAALRRAVGGSAIWALALALALSAIFWQLGPGLLPWFNANPDVLAAAATYLPWLIVTPLAAVTCFLMDGVYIGATRGREIRNGMLLAAGTTLIAMHLLMYFLGNHGIWAALTLFYILRGTVLVLWYPRIPRALAR